MSSTNTKIVVAVIVSFAAGIGMANLPSAFGNSTGASGELAKRDFLVSIDEVKKNLVFGDSFSGTYSKDFTLSDGTQRHIELTPMVHDGMQLIQLKDSGGLTYMSLDGITTNGKLMIQVRDQVASQTALKAQGWK